MKFTHLILTKVNIKWRPESMDEDWLKNRIYLLNNILRPSIKAQTNKNFKFITLWGYEPEGKIDNEIQVYIESENTKEMYLEWTQKILKYIDEEYVLTTRVDSDNALSYDFVDNLHKHVYNFHAEIPYYYDIERMNMLNMLNNKKSLREYKGTSGFCSVLEEKTNYMCIPYKGGHDNIKKYINGQKYNDLSALCVVHGKNLLMKKELGIPDIFDEKTKYGFLL